jgi:hypothetical protein
MVVESVFLSLSLARVVVVVRCGGLGWNFCVGTLWLATHTKISAPPIIQTKAHHNYLP